MSRDPRKQLEEARKKGGWPLVDPRTGRWAKVPDKVMRCPTAGCNSPVEKVDGVKFADRTTPEGMTIFKCRFCSHEFAQITKQYYCDYFEQNIMTHQCKKCPIGAPFIAELRKKAARGETITEADRPCPHLRDRLGMDWVPEDDGWIRDVHL